MEEETLQEVPKEHLVRQDLFRETEEVTASQDSLSKGGRKKNLSAVVSSGEVQ